MSAGHDNGSCDLFGQIRALYSELALHPEKDFGWGKGKNARALGYNHGWLERLPDAVWESSSAVGNPFACGPIHPGETVIDLGCGAGADRFGLTVDFLAFRLAVMPTDLPVP